jgi:hypothetical protein
MVIPYTSIDDINLSNNSGKFLSEEGRHYFGLLNDIDYVFDFTPVPVQTVMSSGPSNLLESLLHKTVSMPLLFS